MFSIGTGSRNKFKYEKNKQNYKLIFHNQIKVLYEYQLTNADR